MIKYYRPYLTHTQIRTLLRLCEFHATGTKEEQELYTKFLTLENSIYMGKLKHSLELREPLENTSPKTNQLSPKEQRKLAYDNWLHDESSVTVEQSKLVRLYRYESDLMTREEEAEYENEMLVNTNSKEL